MWTPGGRTLRIYLINILTVGPLRRNISTEFTNILHVLMGQARRDIILYITNII